MQVITSKDNETVKKIKKLKEKKFRDIENCFIIEGVKLIKEAIEEKQRIKNIVICEECITNGTIETKLLYEIAKYDCIYVNKKIFDTISDVGSPQGIMGIVEKNNDNLKIDYSEDIIIVLDDLQDPGNLGTILRTIDSANLKQVIVSKNTVDFYNSKVVRSTMGAIFRVKRIESNNLVDTLQEIKKHDFEVLCTALDGTESVYDVNFNKKVIVIGNEANGVSKEVQNIADRKVKIPMLGKTESLNAAVAAGIMIYEYVRGKVK
ncbi:MAG TPA: RNA methyltransferase [Clostridiaceae bacterium]|nr:RNA methyltransferase [Clostridiaceae bacterium]